MQKKQTYVPLELLLLNDLLHAGTIEKDIYDKAVEKVRSKQEVWGTDQDKPPIIINRFTKKEEEKK